MSGAAPRSGGTSRILVLGAYGLIGSGVARHLRDRGHIVSGLGRNRATAQRVLPEIDWIYRDMAEMLVKDIRSAMARLDQIHPTAAPKHPRKGGSKHRIC